MLERKGAGESEGWEALERQLKESTEDATAPFLRSTPSHELLMCC